MLDLEEKKSKIWKLQQAQTQNKSPNKSLISLVKGQRKGQLSKTKYFYTITSLLHPSTRRKENKKILVPLIPIPTKTKWGSLDFHPQEAITRNPRAPTEVMSEKDRYGNRIFIPTGLPLPTVSVETVGSLNFTSLLPVTKTSLPFLMESKKA